MVEHLAQRGKREKPKRRKPERCEPHPYRLHHPSKRWRNTALLTDHIVHGVRTVCEERVEQISIGGPAKRRNGRVSQSLLATTSTFDSDDQQIAPRETERKVRQRVRVKRLS